MRFGWHEQPYITPTWEELGLKVDCKRNFCEPRVKALILIDKALQCGMLAKASL